MSTETLLKQLEEYQAIPYRKLVLQFLKQQQETIREQKELIESLWAWAEEKDDEEKDVEEDDVLRDEEGAQTVSQYLDGHGYEAYEDEGTCSTPDYDASVYTRIM